MTATLLALIPAAQPDTQAWTRCLRCHARFRPGRTIWGLCPCCAGLGIAQMETTSDYPARGVKTCPGS